MFRLFTIAAFAVAATPFGILLLKITPPDVARLMIAAIAIAAIGKIGAGQELRLAKGTGPTAFHRFPRHPAFAHHLHGGIQFTGEQIAATAIKG